MRLSSLHTLLALNFALLANAQKNSTWNLNNFNNLVTFGDSYTDENRLAYFINHNGSAPPVAWQQPIGLNTATGGLSWARYASIYSNTTLYNYAVSGAVCSNLITPRYFAAINAPFPSIQQYELPAFLADSAYVTANGTKFFAGTTSDTVYAIWIGTNDLGNDAFLTDSQVPNKTLVDYVDCVSSTLDSLYANGARTFVLLNLAPLNLLPQYATPENGGYAATKFFPDKGPNATEISYRMASSVATTNAIFAYKTPFDVVVARRWPGARVANFDVNALMTDIWHNPAAYLNGSAPLNVTGVIDLCDVTGSNCTVKADKDSYMWYDELHPSEQTSRVIAREFVGVLSGGSKWAKYWA
ncbi:carbohydrate esterase family 16 protein [Pleomassaria siparia CBS 279.74]|uniref:Carbohydrate esterase family 16 protein n=1 Tax=Pleomassaria siparia CBS 279.74 TaxID=1314801 RepID=A0A6G1KNI0_9PLEO|nr:carbohydrate esterase family 16 protein [Pleomassaria siparia CBS 279.74]